MSEIDEFEQPLKDGSGILVSIIVVTFQDSAELDAVLQSVLRHRVAGVEVIVIDGGSSDGSLEILEKYGASLDYWVSEPDAGVYDAMTKGIVRARGAFIYHINAGDRLLYLPLDELRSSLRDGYDGASFVVSVDRRTRFAPSYGWRLRIENTLHHQGTFYRRSVFPGYNPKFKVFADFDVNQRLAIGGARVQLWDGVVAEHSNGGLSSQRDSASELFAVVASNYGIIYLPLTWLNCKLQGVRRRWQNISRPAVP